MWNIVAEYIQFTVNVDDLFIVLVRLHTVQKLIVLLPIAILFSRKHWKELNGI